MITAQIGVRIPGDLARGSRGGGDLGLLLVGGSVRGRKQ